MPGPVGAAAATAAAGPTPASLAGDTAYRISLFDASDRLTGGQPGEDSAHRGQVRNISGPRLRRAGTGTM